jgi:molybdenum cofactor cytidylyltransferase
MISGTVFAVVLAAGGGSRFGGRKLLATWRGRPLVRHALEAAAAVCGARTLLVVGSDWREVCAACAPLPGFFLRNDEWQSGMGGSIALGVRAVREAAGAVLLLLADQPLVTAAHLETLVARWRAEPDTIVASGFAGVAGPPALFPAACFGELAALEGDRGARALLATPGRRVLRVPFEPAAVDIDRPEDLAGLP